MLLGCWWEERQGGQSVKNAAGRWRLRSHYRREVLRESLVCWTASTLRYWRGRDMGEPCRYCMSMALKLGNEPCKKLEPAALLHLDLEEGQSGREYRASLWKTLCNVN
jgi:hypothetical protein